MRERRLHTRRRRRCLTQAPNMAKWPGATGLKLVRIWDSRLLTPTRDHQRRPYNLPKHLRTPARSASCGQRARAAPDRRSIRGQTTARRQTAVVGLTAFTMASPHVEGSYPNLHAERARSEGLLPGLDEGQLLTGLAGEQPATANVEPFAPGYDMNSQIIRHTVSQTTIDKDPCGRTLPRRTRRLTRDRCDQYPQQRIHPRHRMCYRKRARVR